jgi:hypothetical protein
VVEAAPVADCCASSCNNGCGHRGLFRRHRRGNCGGCGCNGTVEAMPADGTAAPAAPGGAPAAPGGAPAAPGGGGGAETLPL